MQFRGLDCKPGPRKAIAFLLALTTLLSLLCTAGPGMADTGCGTGRQGVPADTLTLKVGYFGGPYYTKKVYTLNDFDALPQVKQAYTFIDSLPAVCVDASAGVRLTDLLADAGIDVNSVQKFYFYATDVKSGWYQCIDKSCLLDTTRYYYPNLPSHWDYEMQRAIPGAVYGAVRVEPIMAYKDNWQRYVDKPDFSAYDTSTRFRLLFGQDGPDEHTAPRSAKWVHTIEVMLGGTPPAGVTLDRDAVNLKVGSTVRLTATVAPDEATDRSVAWSSSDTGVATVDKNGLVTVVGPGAATITVSTVVGNLTATCVVNGSDQSFAGQGSLPGGPGPAAAVVSLVSPDQAGSQPWRVFEMSADAVPLQKQKEKNSLDIFAAVLFPVLFFWGSVRRYMEYAREEEK